LIPYLYLGWWNYLESFELCSLSELTVRLMFQNLLGVIGNILATHTRYKRSDDSHFKAFICAALKYVTFLSIAIHVVIQGCYWPSHWTEYCEETSLSNRAVGQSTV